MRNKESFEEEETLPRSSAFVVNSGTKDSETTSSGTKAAASLVGKHVKTPFGLGIVLEYRTEDEVFAIKLIGDESFAAVAILYTKHLPKRHETPMEKADGLNVAYEALEKMRRLNLEIMCHELGIHEKIDHDYCAACLLANKGGAGRSSHFPRLQKFVDIAADVTDLEKFPRFHRLFHSTSDESEESKVDDRKEGPPQQTDEASPNVPPEDADLKSEVDTQISNAFDERNESSESPTQTIIPTAPAPATQEQFLQQAIATKQTAEDDSVSLPRLRSLWGSIQNIPQPTPAQSTTGTANANDSASSPRTNRTVQVLSQKRTTQPPSAFPRIRGFLNSSGASDMFNSVSGSIATISTPQSNAPESSVRFPRLRSAFDASSPSSMFRSMSTSISGEDKIDVKVASDNKSECEGQPEKLVVLPRIQKLIDERKQSTTSPCLICASPSCASHSSSTFRREGITLCHHCEKLFELSFIVDCVSAPDPAERAKHIDHMIDCYDRCMLLLRYSSQFVNKIAGALQDQKEMQDKVGLASSSVGMLSGVLGIAAAASILTPAGPPLLIASLFFGGSATTVQTGTEAMNYFSEPRKLADRIIALHGMALSILRVTSTLRDAMLRDHIRTDVYVVEQTPFKNQMQEKLEKNRVAVLAGTNFGRSMALGGVAGVEVGAVAAGTASEIGVVAAGAASEMGVAAGAAGARSATALSRAGTAAARTVRFARFAGGALSAAVLVMEANAIQSTLKSMHDGSPCDKADTLRRVVQEIDQFPSTSELEGECQAYLDALAHRPSPPVVAEASAVPDDLPFEADIPQATCQQVTGKNQLSAPGAVILEGVLGGNGNVSASGLYEGQSNGHASTCLTSSFLGGSSLIQHFQERRESHQYMAMSITEEVVAVAVDDSQLQESGINLVI